MSHNIPKTTTLIPSLFRHPQNFPIAPSILDSNSNTPPLFFYFPLYNQPLTDLFPSFTYTPSFPIAPLSYPIIPSFLLASNCPLISLFPSCLTSHPSPLTYYALFPSYLISYFSPSYRIPSYFPLASYLTPPPLFLSFSNCLFFN